MSDASSNLSRGPVCARVEQGADRLIVWETAVAVFVGWENSEDDWVACLEKRAGFPAHAWATRMAELYNRGTNSAPTPAGPLTSYAPESIQK